MAKTELILQGSSSHVCYSKDADLLSERGHRGWRQTAHMFLFEFKFADNLDLLTTDVEPHVEVTNIACITFRGMHQNCAGMNMWTNE